MSGKLVTVTTSVQKSENLLSPCSLPPAPYGLNDKFLTGHDITRLNMVLGLKFSSDQQGERDRRG
jgi:hypothetical protein